MIIWQDAYLSIVKVLIQDEKNSLYIDLTHIPKSRHNLFQVFYSSPSKTQKIYAYVANHNLRVRDALKYTDNIGSLDQDEILKAIAAIDGVSIDYAFKNYQYYTCNKSFPNDNYGLLYFHR